MGKLPRWESNSIYPSPQFWRGEDAPTIASGWNGERLDPYGKQIQCAWSTVLELLARAHTIFRRLPLAKLERACRLEWLILNSHILDKPGSPSAA